MALTKVSTGVVDMSGNTGGLVIAKGTTVQQPTCDASILGSIRENTDSGVNNIQVCTSTGWKFLKEAGSTDTPLIVDYLVVAGGGGGASAYGASGAGGGAGEFLYKTAQTLTTGGSGYTVTVGAGGIGGQATSSTTGSAGAQGGDSVFIQTTKGGGLGRPAGGSPAGFYVGSDGGSGGGGAFNGAGGASTAVSPGLGFAGGSGYPTTSYGCGGGGGAGSAGINGTTNTGGAGGAGVQNSITVASGSGPYYAAGGGGGLYNLYNGGVGGSSIGGSSYYYQNATDGAANTGSGGGGACAYSGNVYLGGAGGSGVVILRYPSGFAITFQTGVGFISSTATLSATSEKVTTITAGSGTIIFS